MVVGGVLVGLVVIVGYFCHGWKVVVLMLMMTYVRLTVVIRNNSFIYLLHGFA